MQKFEHLHIPEGDGNNKWFIRTKAGAEKKAQNKWLRIDGEVSGDVSNPENFYYDTLSKAYEAIEFYYDYHKVALPSYLTATNSILSQDKINTDTQSHTMEFL